MGVKFTVKLYKFLQLLQLVELIKRSKKKSIRVDESLAGANRLDATFAAVRLFRVEPGKEAALRLAAGARHSLAAHRDALARVVVAVWRGEASDSADELSVTFAEGARSRSQTTCASVGDCVVIIFLILPERLFCAGDAMFADIECLIHIINRMSEGLLGRIHISLSRTAVVFKWLLFIRNGVLDERKDFRHKRRW